MLVDQLETLKVYELVPRLKHSTIFEWFDKLPPGGSFIIENDHDPLPLYYELKAELKEKLGGFEYQEKGPEIWKVQITKSGEPKEQYDACSIRKQEPVIPEQYSSCSIKKETSAVRDVKTLDVTKLEPRLKHPTIFEWFNKLQPGESFTLKNDHNPKPLYYQMLSELGPVFNWQYKEEGPIWWQVTIEKKVNPELNIGAIAAKDTRKAEAMKKLGIDICCGGNKTIKQAAAEAGIQPEVLEKALEEANQNFANVNFSFNNWDADFLADYIYNQHHKYFYQNRDAILQLAVKVYEVHGENRPELVMLSELVDKLFNELKIHFYKEEKVLFPYIKELATYKKDGPRATNQIIIARDTLATMHMEHEAAGDILKKIRSITNDYQAPQGSCNSFHLLYSKLQELETDLHQHIHLENNILFPKALQLEKELDS